MLFRCHLCIVVAVITVKYNVKLGLQGYQVLFQLVSKVNLVLNFNLNLFKSEAVQLLLYHLDIVVLV